MRDEVRFLSKVKPKSVCMLFSKASPTKGRLAVGFKA